MDTLQELLGVVGRIGEAADLPDAAKAKMRARVKDYRSVLQRLHDSTPDLYKPELERMRGLFAEIEDLRARHAASPEDGGREAKVARTVNREGMNESTDEAFDAIDGEVVRQLAAVAAKYSIDAEAVGAVLATLRPPASPAAAAAVPAGAPCLPRGYVKRAEFEQAVQNLTNPGGRVAPYTVVGVGGAGKTILASALVRDRGVREHFRGGMFWMRAGRGAEAQMVPRLQGLTRSVGAMPTDAPHVVARSPYSIDRVREHGYVAASTGGFPRLMVLDDVWDRRVVDPFLRMRFKLLVTTRDRSVVGVPGDRLELGDMEEDEALQLLLKTSSTEGQPGENAREKMAEVVALCGRLPLALAIAGSMPAVKGNGLNAGAWEELLALFASFVAEKRRVGGEQPVSLDVVIGNSFDSLSERKREELRKTAVLAPGAAAPVEMLLNLWEARDVEDAREEAEGLASTCLLQDLGGGGYCVHGPVVDFVKAKIRAEDGTMKRVAERQMRYLARLDVLEGYEGPEHGAGGRGLLLLAALWRSVEELAGSPCQVAQTYLARSILELAESGGQTTGLARWEASVGHLLHLLGHADDEVGAFYKVCQETEETVLGPWHPSVAISLYNVAELLTAQGKRDEADPLLARAQEIFEKALGREHPNVAITLNNRAGLLEGQGKLDEAEQLQVRATEIWEKTVGPDTPFVASALDTRAGWLMKGGKYSDSESLFRRSVAINEKVFGSDHGSVADVLSRLALLLRHRGKFAESEQLYKRCQMIEEKDFGPDHLFVAEHLRGRAGVYQEMGKHDEAEQLYERCQPLEEKALGPEHPALVKTLNNRVFLLIRKASFPPTDKLLAQDNTSEALSLYTRAEAMHNRAEEITAKPLDESHPDVIELLRNKADLLKIQTRVIAAQLAREGKFADAEVVYGLGQEVEEGTLGPDHLDVAISLNNRAAMLEKMGKCDAAGQLYQRSLAIREKSLGPDHPDVATVLSNLGEVLRARGEFDKAGPLYLRAIEIYEKSFGPEHPRLAVPLNNRALLLGAQGELEQAGALFERAIAIWEAELGSEHPNVASGLNNLASVLRRQGKHDEAESLLRRSLAINEKVHGSHHPDVATDLNNLGEALRDQGKLEEADLLYVRVLTILSSTLGEEHPNYAATLNNRAELLRKQGKLDEARSLFERATTIWEAAVGPEHPSVADVLNNRALLLESEGKHAEAEPLFQRAIEIWEKVHGLEHPLVARGLSNWAGVLKEQGKPLEAEPLYERAQEITEKSLGRDHPEVAKILSSRAELLSTQKEHRKAVPLLEKALSIYAEKLGENDTDTIITRNSLDVARVWMLVE